MSTVPLAFPRRQRVLMLTPDVVIDRRILHEAEALTDAGYEVYLLAGSADGQRSFEVTGRVKVERVGYTGCDPRLGWLYKATATLTTRVYRLSNRFSGIMGSAAERWRGRVRRAGARCIGALRYPFRRALSWL